MADGLDLSEIVRRTVQANAKFYKGWIDLSLEYFRGVAEIFGAPAAAPANTEQAGTIAGTGVLVLEGEEGTAVRGAFLVTNDLGRNVSCELVATEFADPSGTKVRAKADFEPPSLQLAPGEQRVVHAVVVIDGQLATGVGYSGEFAIKGMDGFSVPVVLRRRHGLADSFIEQVKADEGPTVTKPVDVKPAAPANVTARKAGTKRPPPGKRAARQKE